MLFRSTRTAWRGSAPTVTPRPTAAPASAVADVAAPSKATMPRVVFTPSGLNGEVAAGTTVLQAARELGVDLDSVCGGRGICGRCQIAFSEASFPKWAIDNAQESLSPFGDTERAFDARRGMKPDRRLGCCAVVNDDVVLDVPPESQVHRPVVRKRLDIADVVLDPSIALCYLEIGRAHV